MSVAAELLAACGVAEPARRARAVIAEFGTLSAALCATEEARLRAAGGDEAAARSLGALRRAMLHVLRSEVTGRPILSTAQALISYLRVSLAGATEEQLRVLFLNARNELLRDEMSFDGSATAVFIRPRPILKRAMELGATAIILVHNHPSGNPTPSTDDVRATAALVAAAAPLEIVVHDHIIVAGQAWTSLKSAGLMRQAPALKVAA